MDFFARHGNAAACERLFEQAYHANACTVELCEAYREATGVLAEEATWYSLIAEADYRPGLEEVAEFGADGIQLADRFLRNYQVIARNHDEALGLVGQLAERMGESNVVVREFVNEEPVGDAYVGLYEIERESLVFGVGDPERPWPS